VAGASSYGAYKAMDGEVRAKLETVTDSRRDQLKNYLDSIKEDIDVLSSNDMTLAALASYNQGWLTLSGDHEKTLQGLYIEANPNPTGQKEKLDYASDGSIYSAMHAKYHPWFRSFLQARGYYDVFLINKNGDVVYTVFKELDFATNGRHGRWKDSDLGMIFTKALANPKEVQFADFKGYAPSNGVPAAFVSKAIISKDGSVEGVLVFQMPVERINNIMKSATGMGESGETYIVGADMLMRSDSRLSDFFSILPV
jgi:methyl-accepting chemotaxis protein